MLTVNRGYEKFYQTTSLHNNEQSFCSTSINYNNSNDQPEKINIKHEPNFKNNDFVKISNLILNNTFTHYKKQRLHCIINSSNKNFPINLNEEINNECPVNLKKKNYFFNLPKNKNLNEMNRNIINNFNDYNNEKLSKEMEISNLVYNSNKCFFNNNLIDNQNINLNFINQSNLNKINSNKIELCFVKQPAKYHRARYMTEKSRGPIRDKSGKSFPTIKLVGYNNKPVKAYCYLSDDKQISQPHLFYQASKLTSRCLTNCNEMKIGNTITLEFELHPKNNMELIIDCLGIVKQRLFEIQQQQQNKSFFTNLSKSLINHTIINTPSQEKNYLKKPYCRLVFECCIEEINYIVKTYSDIIHCKQMMKAPEIHRMSIKECHVSGNKELFIIGKNFTKDIKLIFKYENRWLEQVTPVKELFHQAHLVCKVPKFDLDLMKLLLNNSTNKTKLKRITVELYAICDNKRSDKELFVYYL